MSAATTRRAVDQAAATAAALDALADKAQPRAATWRLTLADHDVVLSRLFLVAHSFAYAVNEAGNNARFRYGELGADNHGQDVQRAICRAARDIRSAAESLREARTVTRRHLADLDGKQEPGRRYPLLAAVTSAQETTDQLRTTLSPRAGAYGIRLAGHAQIADRLSTATTDLMSACSHLAILVCGAYETAGIGRQNGPANSAIIGAVASLRRAGRPLAVGVVVLRDDAAAGIGGRS